MQAAEPHQGQVGRATHDGMVRLGDLADRAIENIGQDLAP